MLPAVWLPFFHDTNPFLPLLYDDRAGTEDIPAELIPLFEILPDSTCDDHPYLRPLRRICQLSKVLRSTENALKFMQFVQGVSTEFVQRLERLDPRALLIFGYWVSFLCDIEIWWCNDRVHNQRRDICAYLHRYHPEIVPFLILPTIASGAPWSIQ